ncbi:MAG: sulfatase-like hydrolase/transferase [Chitinivibrionales bacterium]|nr:sulfatase-like hydrolase/transferase [Chitinivibrionales bacterium]
MDVSLTNRRDFLKLAGAGTASLALHHTINAGVSADGRPNFLIMLADDLGYGDIQCYGSEIMTPVIDTLAQEGIRFNDCYAAAPVCSPARAGMLTGRTPNRSGIYDWIQEGEVHLREEEITVARLLRDAGYATCHIGKWHLTGRFNSTVQPQPDDHGFEYWMSTQNNAKPSHHNPHNFIRNGENAGTIQGYSSDIIVDEGINWLENHWDRTKPFCLFLWFHSPHEPVATSDEFISYYNSGIPDKDIYLGNVTQLDAAIGRMLDKVDQVGVKGNTFTMFTSDNGPETLMRYGNRYSYGSAGPLRGMKLSVWEGGIRVPGIIRWPDIIPSGQESSEPVSGVDLLPTLCDLAGIDPPMDRAIDGTSYAPLLRGESDGVPRETPLFWQFNMAQGDYKVVVRDRDWKLLANLKVDRFALFNLAEDIGEQNDLKDQEPQRLQEMKEIMEQLKAEVQAEGENRAPITWPVAAKSRLARYKASPKRDGAIYTLQGKKIREFSLHGDHVDMRHLNLPVGYYAIRINGRHYRVVDNCSIVKL